MNRRWYEVGSWLLLVCSAALAGCQDHAFCFDCRPGSGVADASPGNGDGGNSGVVVPDTDGSIGCGTATTVNNCGACGHRCDRVGAFPACVEQPDQSYGCQYQCAPGRMDLNQDLYADPSDGCEYTCVQSNSGVEICDGLDNDCNGLVDEGTDLQTDPNNCGACGKVCQLSQATAKCALMPDLHGVPTPTCVVDSCAPGYQNLDRNDGNGCEYYCEQTNHGVEVCDGLDNDCNGLVDEQDPALDVSSDPANCGSCGHSCAGKIPNAHAACQSGLCDIGACMDGYFDQDQDPANGCEATCSSFCSFPFATAACSDQGDCRMVGCMPDYWDLDQNPANGCEYHCHPTGAEVCDGVDNNCNGLLDDNDPTLQVSEDAANCGACGHNCTGTFVNAYAMCQNGICTLSACKRGFFDTDGDPKNGCEFSCYDCTFPAAVSDLGACIAFGDSGHPRCVLGACETGFLDLDRDPANGCEYQCSPTNQGIEICDGLDNDCNGQVDDVPATGQIASDARNCGACGHSCAGMYPNAAATCVSGQCALGGCLAGYFNRDNDPSNGCEARCSGFCSFPFATSVCDDQGACSMGPCISASYHDLDHNPANGCEYYCDITNVDPVSGGGVEICDGLDNDCNGVVDDVPSSGQIGSDPRNCGACGQSCVGMFPNATAGCQGGGCALASCNDGYFDNDKNPVNGCEFSCFDCSFPGGISDLAACKAAGSTGQAACVLGRCLDGYQNRDGVAANGCEFQCTMTNGGVEICDGVDNDCNGVADDVPPAGQIASDPQNCGACDFSCVGGFTNASANCVSGTCVLGACLPGYFDNDRSPSNGCEFSCYDCFFTAASSDFAACIAAGNQGSARCVLAGCEPGYVDLDGSPANGCEYQCAVTNGGVEICDGRDNDCNGTVDDVPAGGQIATDAANCGRCGHNCAGEIPNAAAACQAGVCAIGACLNGYFDKNRNAADGCEYQCSLECKFPFAYASCDDQGSCSMGTCFPDYYNLDGSPANGCEYFCQKTTPATEVCDGKDNDCNGAVDDASAGTVASDPLNCGSCGHSCAGQFPNSQPACSSGTCALGPCVPGYFNRDGNAANGCEFSCEACSFAGATSDRAQCVTTGACVMGSCLAGYYDLNHSSTDGCEYQCAVSNGGVEKCDGIDNDCNGTIDDGINFGTDAKNCGGCGIDCAAYFPYSTVDCQSQAGVPTCVWTGCVAGHYNYDGVTQNGCEYGCTVSNGGVEKCDGIDNDCDGTVDNPPGGIFSPPLPDACGTGNPLARGECRAGTVCRNGTPTCVQTKGPGIEECNGRDDDCDGVVDNAPPSGSLPQVGAPCGQKDVGECRFGVTQCTPATPGDLTTDRLICAGEVDPQPESCNLKDDDCNGVVDDNVATVSCGTSSAGACKLGTTRCVGGATQCVGNVEPVPEVCDANGATTPTYDNDCNGQVDEGCLRPSGAPIRVDAGRINGATASAQVQHSTYQLSAASAGNLYFVAYADMRDTTSHLFGTYSLDAGVNWATGNTGVVGDMGVTPNSAAQVEPNVFLRTGRVYIAYSRFSGRIRQIYASAASQGATAPYFTAWTAEQRLDGNGASTAVDCFSPQGVVAVVSGGTNDTLGVVWNQIGGTALTPTRNIFFRYTKNGSTAAWPGSALAVNTVSGSGTTANNQGELPAIATDGAGMVYVAWRDKSMGSARVFFRRIDLTAGTPAFEDAFALQPDTAAHDVVADGIQMAADGAGNVHVAWTNLNDSTIRVASGRVCGVGTTRAQCLGSFTTIGGDVNGLVVNPDSLSALVTSPSIAARAGNVVVAWEDSRSGATDIRVNRASYAGGAWNWLPATQRVDAGDPLGATASADPKVAYGLGSTVVVAWVDLRNPSSAVYANVSLDGGTTFYGGAGAYSLRMDATAADSLTPLVLATPNASSASVVWLDYSTTTGTNSTNGDVYVRLLQ